MTTKWTFAIIIVLVVAEFIAASMYSSGTIPYEAFIFMSLMLVLVPTGWTILPIINRWLEKKHEDLDTFDCWKIVKKRVDKTTRAMIPNDEYIPKNHKIFEPLGIYVCEINKDDINKGSMHDIENTDKRLIIMKLRTKKIIWETNRMTFDEFEHSYEKHTKKFITEQERREVIIPTKTTTQEFGATNLSR